MWTGAERCSRSSEGKQDRPKQAVESTVALGARNAGAIDYPERAHVCEGVRAHVVASSCDNE